MGERRVDLVIRSDAAPAGNAALRRSASSPREGDLIGDFKDADSEPSTAASVACPVARQNYSEYP